MQTESDSRYLPHSATAVAHVADRVGAAASLLCAIHCAALPFVLALLPALGLGFLASHGFEDVFIVCASALATANLIHGYRRHRIGRALVLLLPGLVLLWVGGFLFSEQAGLSWHAVLVVIGGSCVAFAHMTNLRLVHRHERAACVPCRAAA